MNNRFFRIFGGINLILLTLFLIKQVDYIIKPLQAIFSMVVVPLLVAGFFYYLLRPLVSFLVRFVKYKGLAILVTFILLILLIATFSYFGGSIIQQQITNITRDSGNYVKIIRGNINDALDALADQGILFQFSEINFQQRFTSFVENLFNGIRNNIFGFFSTLTNIGTVIILIPFTLYYFLKDDRKIYYNILKLLPSDKKNKVRVIIKNADRALSTYINGQLIVAFILGLLTYVGYLIIRLPNALILALFAMVTSFIPFIGPIIGIIPAILIALTTDLWLVLKVIIVLLIVQQLEGNIVQPKIQGNRMEIHPLMVIFVVLSFVIVFGFLGSLFAVPIYSVFRVIVNDLKKN